MIITSCLLVIVVVGCGKKNENEYGEEYVAKITEDYANAMKSTLAEAAGGGPAGDDVAFSKSGEKGTRDNPYKIGDKIYVDNIKGYDALKDEIFQLSFCVNKYITPDNYAENGITSTNSDYLELLNASYRLDGNIDSLPYGCVSLIWVSEDMVDGVSHYPQDSNLKDVTSMYTGVDYEWYYLGDSNTKYKYVYLSCNTTDGIRKIYILLE
jgi:hypothetical protein